MPINQFVAPAPTYAGAGTGLTTAGAANLTPALPSGWQQNDILICHILQDSTVTVSAPTGYATLASSTEPVNTGEVTLFWKRATASESAPTVGPSGVYTAVMHAIRGCTTVGNPWNVTAGNSFTSSSSVSFPTVTTTINNTLIFLAAVGNGNLTISGWTNSTLGTVTEQSDFASTNGRNHAATAPFPGQGATGATTATLSASSTWGANLTVAFSPVSVYDRLVGGTAPMNRSSFY